MRPTPQRPREPLLTVPPAEQVPKARNPKVRVEIGQWLAGVRQTNARGPPGFRRMEGVELILHLLVLDAGKCIHGSFHCDQPLALQAVPLCWHVLGIETVKGPSTLLCNSVLPMISSQR